MREFSHKLVTFFFTMAQGVPVSQVQLIRELKELSRQIFEFDLKIQSFKQLGNNNHIPALEGAREKITKKIPQRQVKLEIKKA